MASDFDLEKKDEYHPRFSLKKKIKILLDIVIAEKKFPKFRLRMTKVTFFILWPFVKF